ncbi:MAG: gliding motility-associated C-terminal domain-containing protein, partial [Flavobacteriales bacterium]|nr:gliding motility-associated C-terminal domain-containing protein [Flavobacteriales bacterium]
MRIVALTFCVALFPLGAVAQPANSDCSTAALLCAEQPLAGNNTGAVGWPGFCANTANVLWYTFTTNSVGGEVEVSLDGIDCPVIQGMGDALSVVVLSGDGSCLPASFASVSVCEQGDAPFALTTQALMPNTQYWVIVAGALNGGATIAAQCDFVVSIGGPGARILDVDFFAGPDVVIGEGESTQLSATGGTTYSWSPTSGLSGSTVPDPISSPSGTTIYTVTTMINGCTFTDEVIVEVIRRIVPPNTITPNDDGINDRWEIPGIADYPGAEVAIHDRWGQLVYKSTGYREPWDGTNGGKKLPVGTYYYSIQLNQLQGRSDP